MNPTSNYIAGKYHCFRKHVGKEFVIQKISQTIRRKIFSPKVYKAKYLYGLGNWYAVGKTSDERECSKKLHLQSYLEML